MLDIDIVRLYDQLHNSMVAEWLMIGQIWVDGRPADWDGSAVGLKFASFRFGLTMAKALCMYEKRIKSCNISSVA